MCTTGALNRYSARQGKKLSLGEESMSSSNMIIIVILVLILLVVSGVLVIR
jgi:hypothetical protein